jgi:hypothetical protein
VVTVTTYLYVDGGRVRHIARGDLRPAALGGHYGQTLCHPYRKAYDWDHTEQWARKWRTDPDAHLSRLRDLPVCTVCQRRSATLQEEATADA